MRVHQFFKLPFDRNSVGLAASKTPARNNTKFSFLEKRKISFVQKCFALNYAGILFSAQKLPMEGKKGALLLFLQESAPK